MALQIYRFSGTHFDYKLDPKSKAAKALLGGKGAGLVMMAQQGLNVPPGFTITTEMCNAYRGFGVDKVAQNAWFEKLMDQVMDHMGWLTAQFSYTPLVSVRSGAPISMPGMMDTILNVGLTSDNYADWEHRIGFRAAADSERRLVQMLGATAYGVPMQVFDFQLAKVKKAVGKTADTELGAHDLSKVAMEMRKAFEENKGFKFPIEDAKEQLRAAIAAVFSSWMNPRAIEYRKINKIDEKMGTAVTVQAMVFGNMGEDSGTGVLFSRDPSTGEPGMMGEFLTNAQGEDVVAGIRTPVNVHEMKKVTTKEIPIWPEVYMQLVKLCAELEVAYKDMVDIEFTVQQGKLFVLQSRSGKRSARAAFRIVTDMVSEGVIDMATALKRLTPEQFKVVRRPMIDPKFKTKADEVGLPACPGVVTGRPVFSAKEAVEASDPVILVTHETNPNDITGMAKAVGILTQTGGATSHAAVVARSMDKTCVVGCTALSLQALKATAKKVTIDGATGNVWIDKDVPVIDASDDPAIKTVVSWSLAYTGGCLASPVPVDTKHTLWLSAANWWGNDTVLESVLDELAERDDCSEVVMDITPPDGLLQAVDVELLNAFGNGTASASWATLQKRLMKRGKELKGLRVVSEAGMVDVDGLVKAGLQVVGFHGVGQPPQKMPADYAVFTALSH